VIWKTWSIETVELTANDNTIYNFIWVDTSKGPLWPRFRQVLGWSTTFVQVGGRCCITGADKARRQVPPAAAGFKGDIPPGITSCAEHLRNWLVFRAFLVDGSTRPESTRSRRTCGSIAWPTPRTRRR